MGNSQNKQTLLTPEEFTQDIRNREKRVAQELLKYRNECDELQRKQEEIAKKERQKKQKKQDDEKRKSDAIHQDRHIHAPVFVKPILKYFAQYSCSDVIQININVQRASNCVFRPPQTNIDIPEKKAYLITYKSVQSTVADMLLKYNLFIVNYYEKTHGDRNIWIRFDVKSTLTYKEAFDEQTAQGYPGKIVAIHECQ